MLLFILNTAYHMWIGMQEIILDYVHEDTLKMLEPDGQHVLRRRRRRSPRAFAILKLSFGVN